MANTNNIIQVCNLILKNFVLRQTGHDLNR